MRVRLTYLIPLLIILAAVALTVLMFFQEISQSQKNIEQEGKRYQHNVDAPAERIE